MKQLSLIIHGRVQGVFFRKFVKDTARNLGLAGWVKNNPDGSVSVLAEGENQLLLAFRDACKQGNRLSKITQIDESWRGLHQYTRSDFQILS